MLLPPRKRAGRFVSPKLFDRVVFVAVVDNRSVVARQNDQRIVGQAELIECFENLPGAPIEFRDRVAARAHLGCAAKTRMRHTRHVDIVRREIEKERLVAIVLDEVDGMLRKHIGDVLIVPAGRFAAGHVADAADAVDDRVVVTVRRFHRQQIGTLGARWLVADFAFDS